MFRNLILAFITAGLVASCASKKKVDDGNIPDGAAGGLDSKVSNEPLKLDATGSDSGKIAGLNTVYFDYDKSSLTTEARKILAENAGWMKKNKGTSLQIEGHTDSRGSVEYNLALGERRARAVRAYLVSLGIDGKHLTIISYGKEKPLVNAETEEAYAKNRRANFVPLVK